MMRTPVALLTFTLALAAYAGDDFWPGKAPSAPVKVALEVRSGNNMALAKGEFDGKPCTLLIDTGATHTTMALDFVKANFPERKLQKVMLAGVTNVENIPSYTEVESLKVGDAEFGKFGIMVLDIAHISSAAGAKVDGIVGMNILGRTRTALSLRDATVTFALGKEAREGFVPVQRENIGDPFTITLKTDDGTELIVDSASTFTFVPSSSHWPSAAEGQASAITASDINKSGTLDATPGKPGELIFGKARMAVRPFISRGGLLSRIGADTLKNYDILIELGSLGIKARERSAEQ